MRFVEPDVTPELFVPPSAPWRVTVQVEVGDGRSSDATIRRTVERVGGAPDAQRVQATIGSPGLEGLLVLPPGPAPDGGWPAVACFGGSEGGFASQVGLAEMLAARGFAALAACWISEEDAAGGSRRCRCLTARRLVTHASPDGHTWPRAAATGR